MNNLLSYCGLVDPRISASDKDLPVMTSVSLSEKKIVDKISFQKNESSTRLFGNLEYIRIFSRFFMWLYFSPWKRILDEIYASKDYVTDTI